MNIALATLVADAWMHGDWGWGWMIVMMLMMLLFWGAILAGIVWLIRGAVWGRSVPDRPVSSETPLEILDRRFAEGELTEEDYRARRKVLAGRGNPVAGT